MNNLNLKPNFKPVVEYYETLRKFKSLGVKHEGAVSSAFQNLLDSCGRKCGWTLIPQYQKKRKGGTIRLDGALVDQYTLAHGFWEAKDEDDDLRREIKKKFAAGYPNDNILFQSPERAILYQNGKEILDADLTNANQLVEILEPFFNYQPPAFEEWNKAEKRFREQLPELGAALLKVLDDAKINNKYFQKTFADFYEVCRSSINPNLSEKAVEEMLIQHLLTERIFRTVFHNSEFTQRNVIAKEIENVILALTSQSFSREEFLKRFDHFYKAIEMTASTIDSFAEKQSFLNNIYERFFRGFSVKVADTHGIVYTPQPIVNFMVKSVEDILQKEFCRSLSSEGVHILDPFVGTGNFIVRVMEEVKRSALEHKYKNELHCNEVMLLPYYIASMNLEHEYFEKIGRYEPFEGLCLVDTFDMTERAQTAFSFMTEENSARIERQKKSPITIVIGNPPYNVGQLNENDNNKNRKYPEIDARVAETYAKDSKATNKNALSDPYVKAIRWATDRIKDDGIVAFVSNSSFIDKLAFDGMRKNLGKDFDLIYLIDLKGDVRQDSMRDGIPLGEAHTIFGLGAMVGISVSFFVKHKTDDKKSEKKRGIYYASVDWRAKRVEKFKFIENAQTVSGIELKEIKPNARFDWLTQGMDADFDSFISIGNKETKENSQTESAIFQKYSRGVETTRDDWVYNFSKNELTENIKSFIETYNEQVYKWHSQKRDKSTLDSFVLYDSTKIKWSRQLKQKLIAKESLNFDENNIKEANYCYFTKCFLYLSSGLVYLPGLSPKTFPNDETRKENIVITVTNHTQIPFSVLAVSNIPDFGIGGRAGQTFPFYIYDEDGSNRRENITDWALSEFQTHYKNKQISKWDIFYYTYALLHHPEYLRKYAANLKRELPRIPFVRDFHKFAEAGKQLVELHANYENQAEYPLEMIESNAVQVDWTVERMRYNKDKTQIIYNDFLTFAGIPNEVHEYRLGNRSALDWIVDQYKTSTDKRSGIINNPNCEDDKQYIVKLIKKIVTISLETVKITKSLPQL
ncbi:MAG TPA: type ISP restriction/modification enzyme [Pyrinomonadaceae bacterium]|jgi:predicted helicase